MPGGGVADDEDLSFASGEGGVEEVALEHHEMLFHEGDNGDGVFGSLRFVNADGVGKGDVEQVVAFHFDGSCVEFYREGGVVVVNRLDGANVAVVNVEVVVVSVLDDFVAYAVAVGAEGETVFVLIESFLEDCIYVADTNCTSMHGDEYLSVGERVLAQFLRNERLAKILDCFQALLGISCLDKL